MSSCGNSPGQNYIVVSHERVKSCDVWFCVDQIALLFITMGLLLIVICRVVVVVAIVVKFNIIITGFSSYGQ